MTDDNPNENLGPVSEGMRPPWYAAVEFRVAGELVPFGAVWAHTKARPRGRTADFVFTVPLIEACAVFAAKRAKPEGQTWADYVRTQLEQMRQIGFESATLQEWLSNARQVERHPKTGFRWVMASVTEVSEDDSAITVRGVAEEFAPEVY
jgi:hypothetical protein